MHLCNRSFTLWILPAVLLTSTVSHAKEQCGFGRDEVLKATQDLFSIPVPPPRHVERRLNPAGRYVDLTTGRIVDRNHLTPQLKKSWRALLPDEETRKFLLRFASSGATPNSHQKTFVKRSTTYRYAIKEPSKTNHCTATLTINVERKIDPEFGSAESVYIYNFIYSDGEVKLTSNNVAG